VFLLSPADCSGKRASQLCRAEASSILARQMRAGGAPLADVFSFLSSLYFRSKLAYALAFADRPTDALVITPSDGLLRTDEILGIGDLIRFASVPIDAAQARYREPLIRDSVGLARRIGPATEVVLLGSVATAKYLAILAPIFGPRLRVPREFIGRGDMSRGALLLRAARDRRELDYTSPATLDRVRNTSRASG
jgi:hypothetical protein